MLKISLLCTPFFPSRSKLCTPREREPAHPLNSPIQTLLQNSWNLVCTPLLLSIPSCHRVEVGAGSRSDRDRCRLIDYQIREFRLWGDSITSRVPRRTLRSAANSQDEREDVLGIRSREVLDIVRKVELGKIESFSNWSIRVQVLRYRVIDRIYKMERERSGSLSSPG